MVAEKVVSPGTQKSYKWNIIWSKVTISAILHIFTIYGLCLLFSLKVRWQTVIFYQMYAIFGSLGVTAGAHRLWSHRAYKASLPLRTFLMAAFTSLVQNSIIQWVRDHRVHHKFTDTDADPYNAKRGLFFSHIGWILLKKHEDVLTKGKTVDMSDVLADPVVQFQKKYYGWLVIFFAIAFPTTVSWYFWRENLWYAFVFAVSRFTLGLHATATVNSLAHAIGWRPYDKFITPTENRFVAFVAYGEGWHNYHHIFPWDYKAAELGGYTLNFTTLFLDFMAKIGWATELKTATDELIRKRVLRTGDEATKDLSSNMDDSQAIWGWGDQDMNFEEKVIVQKVCNYGVPPSKGRVNPIVKR